ncbi:MAG: MFS transporter [Nitrospiraceae bacterium]|nr:MFS transporter [Nitrospiraceae bacterium]
MGDGNAREFSWFEGIVYGLGAMGLVVCSEFIHQWGAYFYSPTEDTGRTIYVALGLMGAIFFVGMLFDAVTDPLVGFWSDHTRARAGWGRLVPIPGRRRPFMFWGSILMVATGVAFWHPPVHGETYTNFLFATAVMCLHWLFFTMYMVPFNSLGPEIARSEHGRAKLGTFYAMGMMIGITITAVAPGMMIDILDPARSADPPAFSAVGYQRTAMILVLVAFVLLQAPVWCLRERYRSSKDEKRLPMRQSLRAALTNKLFLMWFAVSALFSMGFLATQKVLPYWVELVLEGDESTVSYVMIPFVVAALVALPLMPLVTKRVHTKWIWFTVTAGVTFLLPLLFVLAVAPLSLHVKTVFSCVMFAMVGIAQGVLFMLYTPLMGQIIDLDERRTGVRHEGIYIGLSGIAWKLAQALASYVVAVPMALWGNSPEAPMGVLVVGPIAAVFALMGLVVLWFYPVVGEE